MALENKAILSQCFYGMYLQMCAGRPAGSVLQNALFGELELSMRLPGPASWRDEQTVRHRLHSAQDNAWLLWVELMRLPRGTLFLHFLEMCVVASILKPGRRGLFFPFCFASCHQRNKAEASRWYRRLICPFASVFLPCIYLFGPTP